jgi:hypothetical protein
VCVSGSGAPIHFHGDAWNAIAYGRKRWFLFRPDIAMYTTMPIADWLVREYPATPTPATLHPHPHLHAHTHTHHPQYRHRHLRPQEVVQEAGDVLFVPRDWAHGVVNLGNTIGVACEFKADVRESNADDWMLWDLYG